MSHLIEMRKVSKFYTDGNNVSSGFSKVNLDMDIGEFIVITGESGSGKSTLLNVISGLDSYEEGEMLIAGKDMGAFRGQEVEAYRKKYVANIFQDYNLVNSYTAYENVELIMLMNGASRRKIRSGIIGILGWLGLREFAGTKVSKLSGGQKQRVSIARAFAKDAPIIVADEPTGNLDSDSAKLVMETLHKISKEKLVIVVTHNYEQVAEYATRKIIMSDGKIVEDINLKSIENQDVKWEEEKNTKAKSRDISLGSILRLGSRNVFNIPAKFLLLLIIFLFICGAVLSSYSSMMSSEHQREIQGENQYFFDTSPERLVLKKNDESKFNDNDYHRIMSVSNVENIIKNDLALDRTISLDSEKFYFEGPTYSASNIDESDLTYGRLPKKNNEFVIGVDNFSESYEEIKKLGNGILGKSYYIESYDHNTGSGGRIFDKKCTIVGVIIRKAENTRVSGKGFSRFYVTDSLANEILISTVSLSTDITMKMELGSLTRKNSQVVIPSNKVPVGKAFLNKDDSDNYYKNGEISGKILVLKCKNRYFNSDKKFKLDKKFNEENLRNLLGYSKKDFDKYSQCVFVNQKDFKSLFDKGNYQISVYMKNERKSEATVDTLKAAGFNVLPMKKVLTRVDDGNLILEKLINRITLVLVLLALFFISYATIRIIIGSRNSYYSTIRILGGKQKILRRMLWIELFEVMLISAAMVVGFVSMVKMEILRIPEVKEYIDYIRYEHYIGLFVIVTIMSYLISMRYSRKVFSKSAMKSYKEVK